MRYVCVHGHFYQPPRENPWLGAIEAQASAYPHHDWNDRIADECYAPNASSRVLDDRDRIVRIVNNYERISFNFGPTLLAWLADERPEVYDAVIEADRASRRRFSGHGSAMAQPYNHLILPLARPRDRRTQIEWGMEDFRRRFGREPEGMWLPETAVDVESLELLADAGIRFTVLAPHQARRVRPVEGGEWRPVEGGVDPNRPYRILLPSGRTIAAYFYDDDLARAVAFQGLLASGAELARRLLAAADAAAADGPRLVHLATDGETYGHHHRFGEMALSYALDALDEEPGVELTNYSEYLEISPPRHEVEIVENSSWSCAHGVERWRSDCGCSTGSNPEWSQAWRRPLREALDWLAGELAERFEERAGRLLEDPWAARDRYVEVVLDRAPGRMREFVEQHARESVDQTTVTEVLGLLEMQRHAMLMFTSCGWFFDDISELMSVQVLLYAGRALELADRYADARFEEGFRERLAGARSNDPREGTGDTIYRDAVADARADLRKVGANFAITSLFDTVEEPSRGYAYGLERIDETRANAGRTRLAVGHSRVRSHFTLETEHQAYAVLHLGDQNVSAAVGAYPGDDRFDALRRELLEVFEAGDFQEVVRRFDRRLEDHGYTLKSLFLDDQRRVLNTILTSTLSEVETAYRRIYERHVPLMRFLKGLEIPLSQALNETAEFVLISDLRRAIEVEPLDLDRVRTLIREARVWDVELDREGLCFELGRAATRLADRLRDDPDDLEVLAKLDDLMEVVESAPLTLDPWRVQNRYWKLREEALPARLARAAEGEEHADRWVRRFRSLGERLDVEWPED